MSRKEWKSSKDGWAVIGGKVIPVTQHIGSEWGLWRPHEIRKIVRRGGSTRSPMIGECLEIHSSPQEARDKHLENLRISEARTQRYMDDARQGLERATSSHEAAKAQREAFEAQPIPEEKP